MTTPTAVPDIVIDAAECERLENEINRRVAMLEQRTFDLKKAVERSKPNFPRAFCCIGPMVYHDIDEEIRPERRSFCKSVFSSYYFTVFLLIYNLVCSIAGVVTKNNTSASSEEVKTEQQWQHFGLACVYVTGIFLAFVVWYFPVYKALATGDKGSYYQAFMGITIAILFGVFQALGLLGYGTSGFLYALFLKDKKEGTAAHYMAVVNAFLWVAVTCFYFYVLAKVRKMWKEDKKVTLAQKIQQVFSPTDSGPQA